MRERFDVDLLDPADPFEVDGGNEPHLYKHLPTVSARYISVGVDDILDVYLYGDPMYEPADEQGAADWIMIGEAPGIVLAVALAPPNNPNPSKCRPIGLDKATGEEWRRHREWVMRP
jgi:hypothetical protein